MSKWYRLKEDWTNPIYDRRFRHGIQSVKMLPKGAEIYVICTATKRFCYFKEMMLPTSVFDLCEQRESTKTHTADEFLDDVHEYADSLVRALINKGIVSLDQMIDVAIEVELIDAGKYERTTTNE